MTDYEGAAPPEDTAEGWKADPLGGGGLRYWDGSAWTSRVGRLASANKDSGIKKDPATKKSSSSPWRIFRALPKSVQVTSWIVAGILTLVILGALGDEGESGSETGAAPKDEATKQEEDTTFAAPRVDGRCPGQMFVGLPVELRMKVKNPGDTTYEATYFAFWDGSGPFVINSASSDGAPGIKGDYGLQGGYQFRGILKPGQSRRITIVMTPKDVGNFDELKFAVWGEEEDIDELAIPEEDALSLQGCDDITINPGF